MYPVSEAFRTAAKERVLHTKVYGTVGDASFDMENILAGSLSITNQCVGNIDIEVGSVYIGELQCTFRGIPIERNSWAGKTIIPFYSLLTSDGWEDVPLGAYTISAATWTREGMSVTAYDNMSKLDGVAQFSTSTGKAYAILQAICTASQVDLGMSESQVKALPNGDITLGIWSDNDIETWRDMLSYLAAAMGCYATMDRQGRLVLRNYGGPIVDTLDDAHRFTDEEYSDFSTTYSGVYITDADSGDSTYYGGTGDGLVMHLGANPFLQYGAEETLEYMGEAIADSLAVIDYVPFRATAIGNPAYDLGDVFSFSGGIADGSKKYCLMKYTFRQGQNYEMQGVGSNPALANAKSKVEKEIAGRQGGREADKLYFYSYENVEDITIPDGGRKRIIFIRFMTKALTHVVFRSEVCLEVATAGECVTEGTYYLNNNELWTVHPQETMGNGQHTLHFLRDVTSGADGRVNTFSVWLDADGGDVFIPAHGIKALLWGQGLVATSEWDGVIEAYDDFERTNIADILTTGFNDGLQVSLPSVVKRNMNDNIGIDLTGIFGVAFTDRASGELYLRYDSNEGNITYNSGEISIESGRYVLNSGVISAYLYTAPAVLSSVSRVRSYTLGGLFAVSFDGGSTYLTYSGGAWTASSQGGMNAQELEAIPASAWSSVFSGSLIVRCQLSEGNNLLDIEIYGGV